MPLKFIDFIIVFFFISKVGFVKCIEVRNKLSTFHTVIHQENIHTNYIAEKFIIQILLEHAVSTVSKSILFFSVPTLHECKDRF